MTRNDPYQCRIVVTGDELVELRRQAHQIPECPGLDRRIQRYKGKGALVMSKEELDWVIAEERLQRQIERVFSKRGFRRVVRPLSRGYAVFNDDDSLVALMRRRKERWEVLLWSSRQKWEPIGDSGVVFDTVQEAAGYVVDDPLGIFWGDFGRRSV